ncbi:UDP-N-acetylmuramoylalanine/D-glutamate ligase [Coriobacterium glomerans PW2]|uniref:UDP-N-acetylmuramoylalanine--D-glutamate ligase n=1 Tax=Coriobacterium glomerans (strain ATCC 49209 / DSM 20642 / JCM 10262 / PW2) TaxID=700015 RepID=F2NBR4_CORGP|nr:UDP-N-acetylmuramoyl-L-alanine--D-glutamate ligase [Coriobacterium glomerans]AEB06873.1 UDP-N-acetylmuramoylalanine/D-glutamate ligase [Coriobacterium glomerans PW2]
MTLPDSFDLLVLGLGTTGVDVARWGATHLGGRVSSVTVFAGASCEPSDAHRDLEDSGVRIEYGTDSVRGGYDVCVASPGISEFSAFFGSARAHAAEIMGEPEFAWRLSPERWIAVTGTNGKTTTVSLTGQLLSAARIPCEVVGNIGETAISQVDRRQDGDWFVAELSSYQLATTSEFHPRAAVLLNITPDHLRWHRGFENYARAKLKILQNLDENDLAIIDVDDPGLRRLGSQVIASHRRILRLAHDDPASVDAAFVRAGRLVVRLDGIEHDLARVSELAVAGAHNVSNALAASASALLAGASDAAVSEGLRAFSSLEHRMEPAGDIDGVRFYNDSKATNTDAVEKALTAFPGDRVILLLGGYDKGTPLHGFATRVVQQIGAVVCFGQARRRFMDAMTGAASGLDVDVAEADDLLDAVDVARSLACRGDVILLSPACSSFDEFQDFEERGRRFKAYLDELRARGSGGQGQ